MGEHHSKINKPWDCVTQGATDAHLDAFQENCTLIITTE